MGTTEPAGSAAAGHANDVGGCSRSLIERRGRHGLRGGHCSEADAQSKNRSSKQFHRLSFLPSYRKRGSQLSITPTNVADGGASGGDASSNDDASPNDDDANPNGGGASLHARASDGPNSLLPV
jgi:hypothetical protein